MKHPCLILSDIIDVPEYGTTAGRCKITGLESIGLPFVKWVKDTFTDHSFLKPGNIISNEALVCFDEKSEYIQKLSGKEKIQKFRTYSHFIIDNQHFVYTKANKKEMFAALFNTKTQIAVMSESGQKHLFFKHHPGHWQLEEENIYPDKKRLKFIHLTMQKLLMLGFSQKEVIYGHYNGYRIQKAGLQNWRKLEKELERERGSGIFDIAGWLLFDSEKKENGDTTDYTTSTSGKINFPPIS